jgi:cytochrome c oxidase assembly protein subunit 15
VSNHAIARQHINSKNFARLALWTMRLTVLVVLWGAFTRLSGSGDGCGESWPLCKGVIIPEFAGAEIIIEFLHRATSGVVFILSALVAFFARRLYHRGHLARTCAAIAFVLMVTEALLGAVLVIFGWVDQSTSNARVISLSAHLVNTFLLLAAQACTVYFSVRERAVSSTAALKWRGLLVAGFVFIAASGILGVVAALAHMLYPSGSLLAGLQADFASDSPLLVRLRIFHPLLSMGVALYILWFMSHLQRSALSQSVGRRARLVRTIIVGQLGLGVLVLLVGGPVLLKLLHLLVADLLVIAYATLGAELVSEEVGEQSTQLKDRSAP